jgi:hypothetical protein
MQKRGGRHGGILEAAFLVMASETESFSVAGVPTLPADFRTSFVVARTFF